MNNGEIKHDKTPDLGKSLAPIFKHVISSSISVHVFPGVGQGFVVFLLRALTDDHFTGSFLHHWHRWWRHHRWAVEVIGRECFE